MSSCKLLKYYFDVCKRNMFVPPKDCNDFIPRMSTQQDNKYEQSSNLQNITYCTWLNREEREREAHFFLKDRRSISALKINLSNTDHYDWGK